MSIRADQINALKRFKEAYYGLSCVWERKESNLNDTDAVRYYPFHKSFDELNIPGWVDATINELRPIENAKYDTGDLSEKDLCMLSMIVKRFYDEIDFLSEEEVKHLSNMLKYAEKSCEIKNFYNHLIDSMPDMPNETHEQQAAFDKAWEKFYETDFIISFGDRGVVIANEATIYNGIVDTLKELIDNCL
jgi:hypothetical protein